MNNLAHPLLQWEKHIAPYSLGLEQTFKALDKLADSGNSNWPPYNIRKVSDTEVELAVAVAGFSRDELLVEVEKKTLSITSRKEKYTEEGEYLHKGIALRAFSRSWQLGEDTEVGEVSLREGMLYISVSQKLSEADKRRTLPIS